MLTAEGSPALGYSRIDCQLCRRDVPYRGSGHATRCPATARRAIMTATTMAAAAKPVGMANERRTPGSGRTPPPWRTVHRAESRRATRAAAGRRAGSPAPGNRRCRDRASPAATATASAAALISSRDAPAPQQQAQRQRGARDHERLARSKPPSCCRRASAPRRTRFAACRGRRGRPRTPPRR